MTQTTILDKLKIVFDISVSSKLFIAVIAFIILLSILALTTNRKNIKRTKKIYMIVYAIILIAILFFYHDSLGKMFDYMMNNFFIVLYFPNIAVYIAAIITTNIILLVSVLNLRTPKLIKNINTIIYAIMHYLLALVLNIITKNKLDIFSQTSIYSNADAQAVIELSSTIFIIWIVFLIIYKIIRKYQLKDKVPVRKKIIVKKVRILPEGISEVIAPPFVKTEPIKTVNEKVDEPIIIAEITNEQKLQHDKLEQELQEAITKLKIAEEQIKVHEETIKVKEEEKTKLEEEQATLQYEQTLLQQEKSELQQQKTKLLQDNLKLQEAKGETTNIPREEKVNSVNDIMKSFDNMFTLEDYKVLATILKEQQKKKNAEKQKEELRKKEELKFAQLHETYKSVR